MLLHVSIDFNKTQSSKCILNRFTYWKSIYRLLSFLVVLVLVVFNCSDYLSSYFQVLFEVIGDMSSQYFQGWSLLFAFVWLFLGLSTMLMVCASKTSWSSVKLRLRVVFFKILRRWFLILNYLLRFCNQSLNSLSTFDIWCLSVTFFDIYLNRVFLRWLG